MSNYKEQIQKNNEELAELVESANSMALHLQNLTVTENGTYTAGAGYDAIGQVEVAVEGSGSGGGSTETATVQIQTRGTGYEFMDNMHAFLFSDGTTQYLDSNRAKTYTVNVPTYLAMTTTYGSGYQYPSVVSGQCVQISNTIVFISGNCVIQIPGEAADGPM